MLSIVIFFVQLGLFGLITVYLYNRSEEYGVIPLLFFVAGIMGALNIIELLTLFVEIAPDVVIRPGGHVFVPIILLIVLILYVSNGTRSGRIVITGLTGINGLILLELIFLMLYLNIRDPQTTVQGLLVDQTVFTPLFIRGVVASTVTFVVDMFVIIVTYQGIRNSFKNSPKYLVPGIALLVALWVDSVLFNILAFLGTSQFANGISGDVVMKTLAGFLLTPIAGWYLTVRAPNLTHYVGASGRPTFDILLGKSVSFTRLLQLESELQVSRAIYEQIMHHLDGVFWLVDVEKNRLLYLSPNFEKLTGYPPGDFFKNPSGLLNLVYPEDRARNVVTQVFLSADSEFRIVHQDGRIRLLRNRSFPIATADGQIVRYAGITEDITQYREIQTQALALELSREKVAMLQRFVQDASHDLKSPLTAILLKLNLIEQADPIRQKQLHDELRTITYYLTRMIDDLFTLSRIESEERGVLVTVDLNKVIQQVVADQQITAENKELILTLNLTEGRVSVFGNKEQLYRLVTNLISNAIHYTQQGTVAVQTDTQEDQLILDVRDTGIGIPEGQLATIFERFYRTDEARDVRYDGTGLGLAISKAIVEQHQGTIEVQSKVGVGSTFRVKLPIDGSTWDGESGDSRNTQFSSLGQKYLGQEKL